ncbi:MAG: hypothetical protein JWM10_1682, partial [Myxococcaceae bacterium]|nr:hypothetical protein [Myxococcaceae bacterium]
APAPAAPRERAWMTLAVEQSWGAAHDATLGFAWRVEVPLSRRWRLFGGVAFQPESYPFRGLYEWSFGMTRATLGGCVRAGPWAWLDVEGCAGAAVGELHVVSYRPANVSPWSGSWFSAVGELHVLLRPWRRLVIDASGSATVLPFDAYVVSPYNGSFVEKPRFMLTASFGAGVEF